MMCPDCGRLRHDGPCEPVFNEPNELEMLWADYQLALERYEAALAKYRASHKEAAE